MFINHSSNAPHGPNVATNFHTERGRGPLPQAPMDSGCECPFQTQDTFTSGGPLAELREHQPIKNFLGGLLQRIAEHGGAGGGFGAGGPGMPPGGPGGGGFPFR